MKIYYFEDMTKQRIKSLYGRKAVDADSVRLSVEKIMRKVRKDGDVALKQLTRKFDNIETDDLSVGEDEIKGAVKSLSPALKKAYNQAAKNIENFHETQLIGRQTVTTMPGVTCFAEMRPIEKVGLYVPGGTAPLPSTVLMLAIPAKLAGCREVVICTPPQADGNVSASVLYAAYISGVRKIYKVGGAQAIAAMAYGTETIPRVDKIFGPGNQYVTTAKMLASVDIGGPAIDMPAGPTELLVIADKDARADFVAADLLSQAEHGADSQVVLVCTNKDKAEDISEELKLQLVRLPRQGIAKKALKNSFILIVPDITQAISFSNGFAPEHLILNIADAENYTDRIVNAGSVFLGQYSCESAGDYASGTNHSLPTYGYAKAYSGVSVASFQKRVTFQKVSKAGAKNIAPIVINMASEESLEAHRRAMEIRL